MPFAVYMLASRRHGTVYIGVTNNLARRMHEHRARHSAGFAARYEVDRLVWYEAHESWEAARQRELRMKEWRRSWKLQEIEGLNPAWDDLYDRIALP